MPDPTRQIHVFFSAKGGVGKSTLAVACARLAARPDQPVALLDLDLTGTSLADGLAIVPFDLPMAENGALDLRADAPGEPLTPAETNRRRWRRLAAAQPARHLPYLNDAFTTDATDLHPELLAWRATPDDGVLYFPSSPLAPDVLRAVELNFYQDAHHWPTRLKHLLDRLVARRPEIETVVVDLPPGIFGFTYAALSLFTHLQPGGQLPEAMLVADGGRQEWHVRAYLVTSPDHSDLLAALSHPFVFRNDLRQLIPVVNRATARERTRRWILQESGLPATLGLERRLRFVDEEPLVLGRVFQDETFDLDFLTSARPATVAALQQLFGFGGEQP